jgi:hypothetical protein
VILFILVSSITHLRKQVGGGAVMDKYGARVEKMLAEYNGTNSEKRLLQPHFAHQKFT